MSVDFVWFYNLLKKVIDLTNYLFDLLNYRFIIGRFSFFGVTLWEGFSFTLWHAVLGAGGGLIITLLIFRLIKLFVPVA